MLPACNRGAGANVHTPDVCLTPPVPTPVAYVNTAFNATAVAFVPHVFVCGLNAHNLGTVLATSVGDEPGVAHWTIMGWSKYVVGNPTVNVGMLPGENLGCASIGNKGNASSGMCAIPSAVNVFYTSREAPALASSSRELAGLLPLCGVEAERSVEADFDEDATLTLRIHRVTAAAPVLVREALLRVGARRVVLDLRGNPGGDLAAAERLVEVFVPVGSVVAIVVDELGIGWEKRTRRPPAYEGPLEVRVDAGTASAAEVVAAALRDNVGATIVGPCTWGKGTAQRFVRGRLETVAEVRTPNGARIEGAGVTP